LRCVRLPVPAGCHVHVDFFSAAVSMHLLGAAECVVSFCVFVSLYILAFMLSATLHLHVQESRCSRTSRDTAAPFGIRSFRVVLARRDELGPGCQS
jgi:hypothetical protein